MERFLYVFNKHDRDVLLANGYTLIQSDEITCIYVFENQENLNFSLNENKKIVIVPSNILVL